MGLRVRGPLEHSRIASSVAQRLRAQAGGQRIPTYTTDPPLRRAPVPAASAASLCTASLLQPPRKISRLCARTVTSRSILPPSFARLGAAR